MMERRKLKVELISCPTCEGPLVLAVRQGVDPADMKLGDVFLVCLEDGAVMQLSVGPASMAGLASPQTLPGRLREILGRDGSNDGQN